VEVNVAEENKVESKLEGEAQNQGETPATSGLSEVTEQMLQQVEKWKNDFLYLRAEFETYKRNAIKERAEVAKYGSERLLNEILSVTDNFDRAINTKLTADTLDVYAQGVKMTAAELKTVLSKFGVTEVKSEGLPFDPNLHEALGAEESEVVAEGHILRVFRNAYKLHDRLIRPAQVIVAKAKPN
jgi:molecular chaperone GrpE